jgi:hypothetical protein
MCLLVCWAAQYFFSSFNHLWQLKTDGFVLFKTITPFSTHLTSLIGRYQATDTLSHDGQVLDQVFSTDKIQHLRKTTALQTQMQLIGELSTKWYLRSFNNCTGDCVAEDVMGHRAHVAILFHNQRLLVIRIFHLHKLYINQILNFQRLPTYRAIHCLVLKDKQQERTYYSVLQFRLLQCYLTSS